LEGNGALSALGDSQREFRFDDAVFFERGYYARQFVTEVDVQMLGNLDARAVRLRHKPHADFRA
jgi:hypothetical protein